VAFDDAAVAKMQPDGFSLGDQIADGQHQPVVDQYAIAGALGAQRVRAKGVGGDDRVQSDHRGKHAIEIETIVARARLRRQRHFPFSQRGHADPPIRYHIQPIGSQFTSIRNIEMIWDAPLTTSSPETRDTGGFSQIGP
jgi:hypothetical protein